MPKPKKSVVMSNLGRRAQADYGGVCIFDIKVDFGKGAKHLGGTHKRDGNCSAKHLVASVACNLTWVARTNRVESICIERRKRKERNVE